MSLSLHLPLSLYKDIYCTSRFRMNNFFWKSWVCHISRDVSPLLMLEWCFIAYLLMAHRGSLKGGGEFLSWDFLSCELGHKWWFTILLISWIWVAQGVVLIPSIIFIFCIFVFELSTNFWRLHSFENSSKSSSLKLEWNDPTTQVFPPLP